MSFFYPNESKFIEGKIQFNYPEKTMYRRDIDEKLTFSETIKKPNQYVELEGNLIDIKDKYYELKFSDRELQFQDLKMKSGTFYAKKLYVYNLLHHNISQYSNQNIVGEIVIEHENQTPQKSNVYSCFLLQNSNENNTRTVDELLQMIKQKDNKNSELLNMQLNLNDGIPPQKEVIYYQHLDPARKKHIYIFLEPIKVNQESADFLKTLTGKTNLFETNAPMDKKYFSVDFVPKSDKEGFASMFSTKEGMNGYYLDCKPAGETEETTPGYVAPVTSKFTKSKAKTDGLSIMVNLLLFFIVSIAVYFNVPYLYKKLIIEKYPKPDDDDYKSIAGVDIAIILVNFILVILFLVGSGLEMENFFLMGIIWFLLMFMSIMALQIRKVTDEFWTTKNYKRKPPTEDFHEAGNLFSFVAKMFSDILNNVSTPSGMFALGTLAVGVFGTLATVLGLRLTGKINETQAAIAFFVGLFISVKFFLMSYLFAVVENKSGGDADAGSPDAAGAGPADADAADAGSPDAAGAGPADAETGTDVSI